MQGYDRMTEMKTSFLSCFKTKLNKDGQNLSREVCNMRIMDLAKFLYLKCTTRHTCCLALVFKALKVFRHNMSKILKEILNFVKMFDSEISTIHISEVLTMNLNSIIH